MPFQLNYHDKIINVYNMEFISESILRDLFREYGFKYFDDIKSKCIMQLVIDEKLCVTKKEYKFENIKLDSDTEYELCIYGLFGELDLFFEQHKQEFFIITKHVEPIEPEVPSLNSSNICILYQRMKITLSGIHISFDKNMIEYILKNLGFMIPLDCFNVVILMKFCDVPTKTNFNDHPIINIQEGYRYAITFYQKQDGPSVMGTLEKFMKENNGTTFHFNQYEYEFNKTKNEPMELKEDNLIHDFFKTPYSSDDFSDIVGRPRRNTPFDSKENTLFDNGKNTPNMHDSLVTRHNNYPRYVSEPVKPKKLIEAPPLTNIKKKQEPNGVNIYEMFVNEDFQVLFDIYKRKPQLFELLSKFSKTSDSDEPNIPKFDEECNFYEDQNCIDALTDFAISIDSDISNVPILETLKMFKFHLNLSLRHLFH